MYLFNNERPHLSQRSIHSTVLGIIQLLTLSLCELTQVKDKCEVNNIFWYLCRRSVPTPTLIKSQKGRKSVSILFLTLLGGSQRVVKCGWPYFLVVLHVQVVLVSVLVAVGQGNDGDGVDGLHQSSLRECLCHHLAAKVWHRIPDGKTRRMVRLQSAAELMNRLFLVMHNVDFFSADS